MFGRNKPGSINNNSDLERRVKNLEAIEEERKTVERVLLNGAFDLMGYNPTARIRKERLLTLEINTGWGKSSFNEKQCVVLRDLLNKHFPVEAKEVK